MKFQAVFVLLVLTVEEISGISERIQFPSTEVISKICGKAIGISNSSIILNKRITAKSVYKGDHTRYGAHLARLHHYPGYRANPLDLNDTWIVVELEEDWVLTGIATQGYGDKNVQEWVTEYVIMTSPGYRKGDRTSLLDLDGKNKIFKGNEDTFAVNFNGFPVPVIASSVALHPNTWHKNVALRMELYGCKPGYRIQAMVSPIGFPFMKSYLDPTSVDYISLAADIKHEIYHFSRTIPGFLSAKVMRFNPWNKQNVPTVQTEAEVEIQCIPNTTDYYEAALQEKVGKDKVFLDPNRLYFHHLNNKDYQCAMKINLSQKVSKVNRMLTTGNLSVEAKHQCKVFKKTYGRWEAAVMYESSDTFSQLVPLKGEGVKVTIQGHKFPPSLLYVRHVVKTEQIEVFSYGLLQIDRPPLVGRIIGPTRITKGIGYITLDASKSFDPDISIMKDPNSNFTFTWFCKREDDFTDAQYSARRKQRYRFRYRYRKQFLRSIPADVPNGRPFTDDGCFGFGPGRLTPKDPILRVNTDKMKSKFKYIFRVIVTKGRRKTETEHTLKIDPSVWLKVRCTKNCININQSDKFQKVSQLKNLFVDTKCIGTHCPTISNYRWTLFTQQRNEVNGSWWKRVEQPNHFFQGFTNHRNLIMTNLNNVTNYYGMRDQRIKIRSTIKLTVNSRILEEEDELILVLNSPPRRAKTNKEGCKLTPLEGRAWSTHFKINCGEWYDEDGPVSFEFRYKRSNNIVIIKTGSSSNVSTRLPRGIKEDNDLIAVQIKIHDKAGDFTMITRKPKVRVLDYMDLADKIRGIVKDTDDELDRLVRNNQRKSAYGLAIALCSVVETPDNNTNTSTNLRKKLGVTPSIATKLKSKILQKLDASRNTTNWEETTQTLTVVNLATENPDETSPEMQENALKLLGTTVDFMTKQILQGGLSELERSTSLSFIEVIGNLLESFANAMSNDPDMKQWGKGNRAKTEDALRNLRKMSDSLMSAQQMDEDPGIFSTTTISVIVSKNSPSRLRQISGKPIKTITGREIIFPFLGGIFDSHNASSLSSVQSKIILFTNNPYTWDSTAKLINSYAIDINLYNNGKKFEVSNLKNRLGIFIPEDTSLTTLPTAPNFVKPTQNSSDVSRLRYHTFDIKTNEAAVMLRIEPSDGRKLEVFVSALERPLPWKYNYTTIIPNYRSCKKTVNNDTERFENCTLDPYMFMISRKLTGLLGKHFVGIRYLKFDDVTKDVQTRVKRDCGPGRRKKRSCVGVKDPPTMPVPTRFIIPEYNETTDVNYTLSISSSSCLYWSKRMQKWSGYGCEPGPKTVKGSIHCVCNHLTTFGGDFFVQPNPIDFDKVWLTLSDPKLEDFVVMATIVTIVLIYLIGLLFARRADKNDERKAVPEIYLSDRGDYLYEISVATGLWRGNGTTANVGLILYGENGYTDTINLNDNTLNKRFFARGSVNTFMIYLPKCLGNLYKIKIWHDNRGVSPAWFLREVVVKDDKEETQWIFLANKWLALEKGDGEIETDVQAAEKKEIRGFKNVFHSRASHSLADGHLWASVFMRPPQSTFTRVQRLSCCLSIIFATMVTNAMFYQFGDTVHDTFQLGPLKVSWTQVKIGLQSALVAIPVNAIIVTIFRNARPKEDKANVYQAISSVAKGEPITGKGMRHGFIYLGWFLCIGTSIASAVVIILYSLSWGGETANEWLTSILVSMIQDIFLTQPIKVILLASLLALLLKKPPKVEKVRGSPRWKNKLDKKNVSTLKGEELEKARLARKKIFKTARVFTEIVTYVLFAILLFIVCYGNRKTNRFDIKQEMEHIMKRYDKVRNISGFWKWMEKRFIPGIYNATWYNGQPFSYEEGFISNKESYLVGMPRLRQLRIKSVPCITAGDFPSLNHPIPRCIPFYSPTNEYKARYHKSDWSPVPNASVFQTSFDLRETCPRPWRYQNAADLNALAYKGTYASYSGGGYVADLGYNNESASSVVQDLKNKKWIDNGTAAVLVELTVFEPATLLFSAVKTLFERLPTGSLKPAIRVEPLTVYGATDPGFKKVYQTSQLLFVLVVSILFACECFKVYKKGCLYFTRFWSWLDLILITSALLAMGTLFFKEKYVSKFIKGVHENPFESTSTDFIVLWSNIEVYLLSFVIFIMTIKFLRLLRFNSHIGNLMHTLKHSTKNLQSFYVVLCIVLIAFTQVGMLLFGKNIEQYSTFVGSLSIVLQKLLGTNMQINKVQRVNKILGLIYTFTYSVTVALLLLNVFLSILNTSYKEVRESRRKRAIGIALRKYIEDYLKSLYRELMKEFKGLDRIWKRKDVEKLEETDGLLESKEPLETSDAISYEAGELCSGAVEVYQSDPLFEMVDNEQSDIIRYLVPLATFDNEDDILGELAFLEEIKMSLKNIERDLLQATNDDNISGVFDPELFDNKSEESFKVGSTLSVAQSICEAQPDTEKHMEHAEKDEISLYSSEEDGISDEQDEIEEHDLYNTFPYRSGISMSMTSINERCALLERERANTQLLSPHRNLDITPNSFRL